MTDRLDALSEALTERGLAQSEVTTIRELVAYIDTVDDIPESLLDGNLPLAYKAANCVPEGPAR